LRKGCLAASAGPATTAASSVATASLSDLSVLPVLADPPWLSIDTLGEGLLIIALDIGGYEHAAGRNRYVASTSTRRATGATYAVVGSVAGRPAVSVVPCSTALARLVRPPSPP